MRYLSRFSIWLIFFQWILGQDQAVPVFLNPSRIKIDGFQLYNQLNSTPAKCTVDSGLNNSSLKDFTIARERKGGTIMPMAMERIKSHPICLEGGVGQIRVKKTAGTDSKLFSF